MSFDNLPPQSSIHAKADAYGAECLRRSRAVAETMRCKLDIPYGTEDRQQLDLYLPASGAGRDLPVLLFLHGGGWTHGYKEWCGFSAPALVDLPCIFVAVSYRLIPAVAYPAPVKDGIAALQWVHRHIAEFGGSPERLFVGGHSAGGHIAASMALNAEWLAEARLPADIIRGVFCLSATLNRRMVNPAIAPDHVPPGGPTDVSPDSPVALAARVRTPFHISWGGNEHERMERSATQMAEAIRRAGGHVETQLFPGWDHFDTHLNTERRDRPWVQRVRAWMAAADVSAAANDELRRLSPAPAD